ncbi:hypothetical protein EV426DRAFT_395113 [Tirmania nivea]|nr:hypothetical protein EV426DRAFT_395113 [Tirmania nivea]
MGIFRECNFSSFFFLLIPVWTHFEGAGTYRRFGSEEIFLCIGFYGLLKPATALGTKKISEKASPFVEMSCQGHALSIFCELERCIGRMHNWT